MASLLEKVRTLVAADLNRAVDRGLSSTSDEAMYRHQVRELQSLQEQLTQQMVNLRADITEMRRRSDAQQGLVVQQDLEVDSLLRENLQEEALAAQERLNLSRATAGQLAESVERLEAEYAQLAEAKGQLDARINTVTRTEPAMRGMLAVQRAKQLTGEAMKSLDDLAGAGDVDAAHVVNAIRGRLAEAEAQLSELELRGLAHGETPDVLKRKELEAQLEARKQRLGL
jgi:hypothetical protein